jgi:acetyl-CoA carboxylase beta subunit
MLYRKDLEANLSVCTKCTYHFRMHAYDRINMLVDGDFIEIGMEMLPGDPLGWVDKRPYPAKLEADRKKSNLSEAVVTGFATLDGFPVALGVMDFNFRERWARSWANASRICSKKRIDAACRASSLPQAVARGWKKVCSR